MTRTPVITQRKFTYPPPTNTNNGNNNNNYNATGTGVVNVQQQEQMNNDNENENENGDLKSSLLKRKSTINTNPLNLPIYYKNKSWFRWVVLCLSCWAMFGSYYCYDNPAALTKQIKHKYNLSPLKYNLLYTVYSLPNMILPLFGGVLVDKFGAEVSLIFFLALVTCGQAVFAFAADLSSYPLMLVGRVIFGFGGESLCVAESALLAVYFSGSEMALAMGLNLSLGRAGSALNDYLTLAVYNETNSIPTALWCGFFLLTVCMALTCLMVIADRYQSNKKRKQGYFVPVAIAGDVVKLADIKEFGLLYWLLTCSCIVVYGCVLPWNNIGSDFMQHSYHYSSSKANHYLMIPYLTSAVLTPFCGYAVDKIGHRSQLLLVSASSLTIAHFLFAFAVNPIPPIVGLLFIGVGYSVYASAIWPAVALVVNDKKVGTAYGLITAVQNAGLALFPLIVGVLTGIGKGRKYKFVEIFFFSLGLIGICIGFFLLYSDNRAGNILKQPSIKTADADEVATVGEEDEDERVSEGRVQGNTRAGPGLVPQANNEHGGGGGQDSLISAQNDREYVASDADA